nr:Helix-turn-helix domain protein [uncultured bacterium]
MLDKLQTGQTPDRAFQPATEFLINNVETLKVAADATRLRIMEALAGRTLTVKQLARILDTTPTKLYYHVNLLESHGLITVTASRIVSGIIEKQYRATAFNLRVDRALMTIDGRPEQEGIESLLTVIFDATRNDVLSAARHGMIKLEADDPLDRNAIFARAIAHLTRDQFKQLYEQVMTLLHSFKEEKGEDVAEVPTYGLTVALYPLPEAGTSETNSNIGRWNID